MNKQIKVTRRYLPWFGSGYNRAPWTISHFPKHDSFLDLFCGSAAITMLKEPSGWESINDLDGRTINFMRQLKDNGRELLDKINLTPYAEDEYKLSKIASTNPLEDARRFFCLCWMSHSGGPLANGFRVQIKQGSRYTFPPFDLINRDDLIVVSNRLRQVQIFNRDGLELVRKFLCNKACLIYADPPFVKSTRERKLGYNHEFTDSDHVTLANLLRSHMGYAIVAGYQSALYKEIYEDWGWQRKERQQRTGGKKIGVECLWLSPRTVAALEAERAPTHVQQRLI